MSRTRLGLALAAILVLPIVGCGPSTPQQRLAGRWIGRPEVKEAVDAMVQSTAPGQEVNPLAQGAARFLGNALAKATMSVEIDLRPSGAVFLRGNTELLGMPPDSDGTWTVISADEDRAVVEFEIEDKTFRGKLVLRDADEFTLKIEEAAAETAAAPAETPAAVVALRPAAPPVATSDDDKDYEDDDAPAHPNAAPTVGATGTPGTGTPAAGIPATRPGPTAGKPGAPAAPKQPPAAILFKRASS